MTTHLGWSEVLLRLTLTAIAGALVGMDRGERGHAAGLRTTMLVCLAASVAMIEANLLMDTRGKTPDSFVVLDLMRFPLGILSGIGFIGAGAILRKGNRITGVTTAATLWFVTVMGLCFGGGQLALGSVALILALFVLAGLKKMERHALRFFRGTVTLTLGSDGPSDTDISRRFEFDGFRITGWRICHSNPDQMRKLRLTLHAERRADDLEPPALIKELAAMPGVLAIDWRGWNT